MNCLPQNFGVKSADWNTGTAHWKVEWAAGIPFLYLEQDLTPSPAKAILLTGKISIWSYFETSTTGPSWLGPSKSFKKATIYNCEKKSLDSGLRRQKSKCQLPEGGGRWGGREEFVLFHSTNTTSVLCVFFSSSPERQLSNSFKCVKPNLYFLTGCSIWVLNKEEQINVWPSLRAPHIRVENAAMGAQHSQQSNANVPGWLWQGSQFWGCLLPQLKISKVRDNGKLEVPCHSFYKVVGFRIWKSGWYSAIKNNLVNNKEWNNTC